MTGSMTRMSMVLALAALAGCVSGSVRQKDEPTTMKEREPKAEELRKKVAVADFEDKSGYGRQQVGAPAADILSTILVDCEQFAVYERQQISKAIDELKLGQSGVLDPTTVAQAGKGIGVDYVFYGTVTKCGFRRERTNLIVGYKISQVAEVTVMVRMIHVQSQRIVFSKPGDGEARRDASGVLGVGGSMSYDSGLFADAMRAAIYKMLDEMIDKAERTGK